MTNTEYIKGMLEEPLLLGQLDNGKCPECGSNRFDIYEERLVAIAVMKGKAVKVSEQDQRDSATTVRCQKCAKEIYSD